MLSHSDCADHVALLAPVPKEHLVGGTKTSMTMGKVAFGSRAYDFRVSWHARYLGYVGAVNGAHPDGMKVRPASTAKYAGDNEGGDWLLFWEVDHLDEIPESERMHVGEFVPYEKKKPYGNSFAPRGLCL